MKIDLSFSAGQFDDLQLRDKNVVVLDVLRASSTITVALNNGAREIIPVASIESAVKISGSLFGEVTLRGGERNGEREGQRSFILEPAQHIVTVLVQCSE